MDFEQYLRQLIRQKECYVIVPGEGIQGYDLIWGNLSKIEQETLLSKYLRSDYAAGSDIWTVFNEAYIELLINYLIGCPLASLFIDYKKLHESVLIYVLPHLLEIIYDTAPEVFQEDYEDFLETDVETGWSSYRIGVARSVRKKVA